METKIKAIGSGIDWEIIGESLFDCIEAAYRQFKGREVELVTLKSLGYIDGQDLFIHPEYLDRGAIKEIVEGSK